MAWVLLVWLTVAAFVAAVALAVRLKPAGRAELLLASTVLWNLLLVAPIYALSYAHALTARTLAIVSVVLFHGVIVAALPSGGRRGGLLDIAAALIDIVVLPFEALGSAARARSLVTLPIAMCCWLIVYTAIGSYYTPSWRQWDSLWYHETIVGYVLQNHGFGVLDLPGDLQKVNGYPRLCEMTHLWFVIFTDRRLIEVATSLLAPGFVAACYLLVKRFSRDTSTAVALAAALMLMPTAAYLLESTYIDVHVAMLVLGATYYATRPELRLADVLLAIICLAMATSSKFLVVPNVAVLSLITVARLFHQHGVSRRSLGMTAVGTVAIGGAAALVYLRNWLAFKNPFWPDLNFESAKLGLRFVGGDPAANLIDMNVPWRQLVDELSTVPYSLRRSLGPREQLYDYGFAITFVVFPIGFLAAAMAFARTWVSLLGRIVRRPSWVSSDAENAVLVALPTVAGIYASPALWSARYQIAHVATLAAMVAWLGGRKGWSALSRDAAIATSIGAVIAFFWVEPRWWYLPTELAKLARIPYPEREVTPASAISPGLSIASGSAITREVGLERERTIGPGSVVAYNDREQFIALLWNNEFSNRVQYVPMGPGYVDRVEASGASWVYCRYGDPAAEELARRGWTSVGTYNVEGWGSMLRRTKW